MKKSKGKQIDLLYSSNETENKKKRNTHKKKIKEKSNSEQKVIDLDKEIIIGMTPKQNSKKNKSTVKKTPKKGIKKSSQKKGKKKVVKNNTNTKKREIIKWTSIIALIIIVIIIFMLSDVFNIKQIIVENNKKISSQEIISLSGLTTYQNIFKINKKQVKTNIKGNAYISDLKISRNLFGTVTIIVKERETSYMLEFINAYVYVDKQGYMLEISNEKKDVPIIEGILTPTENIKVGERLIVEDLKKLDDINQIMENAKNQKVYNLISKIDISDNSDYILTISSEDKVVHFSDTSNINTKILLMLSILEQEKGHKGEIFLDDIKKAYFRESVEGNNI